MYRHKLRLVSYIIHNEKLSNSPLLIARARLQVLLGSVIEYFNQTKFVHSNVSRLRYEERCITRFHTITLQIGKVHSSQHFTVVHTQWLFSSPKMGRRIVHRIDARCLDGITSLRPSVLLPKTSVYRSNFWYCATGSKSSYLFHFNAECVL